MARLSTLGVTVGYGIDHHTSALRDVEGAAKTSDALLPINDGAVVFAFDSEITIQEKWREYDQTDKGHNQVEHTFYVALKSIHSVYYISTFVNCHIDVPSKYYQLLYILTAHRAVYCNGNAFFCIFSAKRVQRYKKIYCCASVSANYFTIERKTLNNAPGSLGLTSSDCRHPAAMPA